MSRTHRIHDSMTMNPTGARARKVPGAVAMAAVVALAAAVAPGPGRAGQDDLPSGRPPSPCRVTITAPRPTDLLYGVSDLAAEVACPGGEVASEVVFLVDGRVVASLARSPFKTAWDAGSTFAAHQIEARVIDRTGRLAADRVLTPGAAMTETVRVTAAPMDLVELSVGVVDRDGVPIRGLTSGDFTVEEDGRPQAPVGARAEDRPLSLVVLLDVSSSMRALWPRLREAAPDLADALGPEDEVKIVAFSGPAYRVQDFTRDPSRVRQSMERFAEWGGGTSLYDTVAAVGTELAWGRPGRQVVVLLTDGVDTLSRIDATRLRNYLRRTEVTVETLAVPTGPQDAGRAGRALKTLRMLARETGGDVLPLPDARALAPAFAEIARGLRSSYCVSWRSDLKAREGWRSIRVAVRVPGATVRTRAGRIGARSIGDFLVADLGARDVAVRRKAAEWLGTLPVEEARDALLGALGDRAVEVRSAAAVSLGRLREMRAVEPLIQMLHDANQGTRLAAAEGLRAVGPPAVPALVEALDRSMPRQQLDILPILGDIGDTRALEAIERLARPAPPPAWTTSGPPPGSTPHERSERTEVRIAAIGALGGMESPSVVPVLSKGARDPAPAVREAALRALQSNATPEAFAGLEELGERAALLQGIALLAERGRLGEWLRRPEASAIVLRVAQKGAVVTPMGKGPATDIALALGGERAVASVLDLAARFLPEDLAQIARSLAYVARWEAQAQAP